MHPVCCHLCTRRITVVLWQPNSVAILVHDQPCWWRESARVRIPAEHITQHPLQTLLDSFATNLATHYLTSEQTKNNKKSNPKNNYTKYNTADASFVSKVDCLGTFFPKNPQHFRVILCMVANSKVINTNEIYLHQ